MIRLRTLGQNTIEVGGVRIGPESTVLFGLLLFLAVHRGRTVSRSRLRELLWPGVPEDRAWHALRQLLYRVRRLGIDLETDASHVMLSASHVDADFFLEGTEAEAAFPNGSQSRIGPFLSAYYPRFSDALLAWVDEQRSVVHARLRDVLLRGISTSRARGNWRQSRDLRGTCSPSIH
jgi:DNA-binding SARP family transcriptional activator